MAIRFRRGNSDKFNPSKMSIGEPAVVLDTRKVYMTIGTGDVVEIPTSETVLDMMLNNMQSFINDYTSQVDEHVEDEINGMKTQVNTAISNVTNQGNYAKTQGDYAKTQGDYAKNQGDYAKSKGLEAQSIVDSTAPIINTNLQATYSNKATGLSGKMITSSIADDGLVEVTKIEGNTEQVVSVQGKNLFDGKLELGGLNSSTGVVGVDSTRVRSINFTNVTPSTTYTRSIVETPNELHIFFYDINKSFISRYTTDATVNNATFTTPSNCHYIKFRELSTNTQLKIQLELGSTATTYEPFSPNSPSPEYPSPLKYAQNFDVVSCGKNLYNSNASLIGRTVNGTTGIIGIDSTRFVSDYIIINPSWTISVSGTSNSSSRKTAFYDINKKFIRGNTTDITFINIPQNATYVVISDLLEYKDTIQLEVNSQSTPYEPYIEDRKSIQFLSMSLPNGVKNTIELIDGVWTKVQRVKEVVFDGSETWWDSPDSTSTAIRFGANPSSTNLSDATIKYGSLGTTHFSSDKFKQYTGSALLTNDIEGVSLGNAFFSIKILKSRLSTVDVNGFKTWLTSNPITVQYELTTPIYTPIDPLYLTSYKGTTNVFTTSSPQVTLTANMKSELWSRDYLQDEELADAVYYTDTVELSPNPPLDADLLGGSPKSYFDGLVNTNTSSINALISALTPQIATLNINTNKVESYGWNYYVKSYKTITIYVSISLKTTNVGGDTIATLPFPTKVNIYNIAFLSQRGELTTMGIVGNEVKLERNDLTSDDFLQFTMNYIID